MTSSPIGKIMNTRVLELIKNPKIISESDLSILEAESKKMPYAQSIRALYLYGINLHKSENYKENLSKTAAYTTDKKILYQFINSQRNSQKEEIPVKNKVAEIIDKQHIDSDISSESAKIPLENPTEDTAVALNKFDIDKIIESENKETSDFIFVEGEKNRLLYEGEENFLEQKSQEIDLATTKESGMITLKEDSKITDNLIINDENRSEETISEKKEVGEALEIPEGKVSVTKVETKVQDEDLSGNISFNGIEDFLPKVKFSVPKNHLDHLHPPKRELSKENRTEEKTVSQPEYKEPAIDEISEDELDNSQISFGVTQTFEVSKSIEIEKTEAQSLNQITEKNTKDPINFEKNTTFQVSEFVEIKTEVLDSIPVEQPISTWKPMSFSANTPDALIGKAVELEKPEVINEIIIDDEKQVAEEKPQIPEAERPVMNVSFFGNEVAKILEEEKEIPATLEKPMVKEIPDSNVGTFINTWQNWLKIDRPKTCEPAEKTIVVKEKIIDQFIEKNPKISQLKDEVNFVVKEKKDDISHLMTETLARLYVEQKLYSKAIKAYEILSEKHPQKIDYFKEKIKEIKDLRKS